MSVYRESDRHPIIVVALAGDLVGLDRDSGAIRWRTQRGSRMTGEAVLAIAGQQVFTVGMDSTLYCHAYLDGALQ
jgi:hypothetical protein